MCFFGLLLKRPFSGIPGRKKAVFLFLACFFPVFFSCLQAYAAGPDMMAKADRSLWPSPVNTKDGFDRASIHEMLAFTAAFSDLDGFDEDQLREFLGLKGVDTKGIQAYKKGMIGILERNFENAGKRLAFDQIQKAARALKEELPDDLKAWYENAYAFYRAYLYEQMRLAALFAKIPSEIRKINADEFAGMEFPDRTFVLTFDDGPTKEGGTTDRTIAVLRAYDKPGIFFALGENLDHRLNAGGKEKLVQLYGEMSVGSHGRTHKAHKKAADALEVEAEIKTLGGIFGKSAVNMFRPPYGQRSAEVLDVFKASGTKTILWNIDTQDWSRKITALEVKDRLMSLMLFWRSGIILFHDVHPKAAKILPDVFKAFGPDIVSFTDGFPAAYSPGPLE